jgi:hypothetical protein
VLKKDEVQRLVLHHIVEEVGTDPDEPSTGIPVRAYRSTGEREPTHVRDGVAKRVEEARKTARVARDPPRDGLAE